MVGGQPTPIGVERRSTRPVETQASSLNPGTALALRTETKIFQNRQHGDTERVVDHGDIHFRRAHARLAEGRRGGLHGGGGRQITADRRVFGGLSRTQNPHGRFGAVACHIRAGNHHGTSAVRNHAALEQMQGVRNHP